MNGTEVRQRYLAPFCCINSANITEQHRTAAGRRILVAWIPCADFPESLYLSRISARFHYFIRKYRFCLFLAVVVSCHTSVLNTYLVIEPCEYYIDCQHASLIKLMNVVNKISAAGFEVLTALSTKMTVFWVVAPCSLVEVYQRPCCVHHQSP
jgi:hypothetical protein